MSKGWFALLAVFFFIIFPAVSASSIGVGQLCAADPIVGDLMVVSAGTFVQGSPVDEPCRYTNETQFTHTLTRNLAVMATEVTRQMWADLQAAQPTLPADPTSTSVGAGMSNPVQNNTWYEAVLFANLLSVERGLTRCYYTDAGFTTPVTSSNYTTGPFYCNFDANGYRLPTEGEWENFCRAGTTTTFWIVEPNYSSGNCTSCTPGLLPNLESAEVFCANYTGGTANVATKQPNPWGLYDTLGNVREWCWDWYSEYYPAGSATDYPGAASGTLRVRRGGACHYSASSGRSAARGALDPSWRDDCTGFRLVRTVSTTNSISFPQLLKDQIWTTRLGVTNPHAAQAELLFKAYDSTGEILASVEMPSLAPSARLYQDVGSIFSSLDADQLAVIAWVQVTSDRQLQGFAEYNTADGQRKMFAEAVMSPANRLYIPHIAAELPETWWTQASLTAGVGASSKTLQLGTGGQYPLSDLAADNSQAALDLNSYFPSAPGSGEAVGEFRSSEADLGGVVMFGRSDSVQVASALTLKSRPTRTLFYSHVAQDGVWWTGFTVYNVSSQTAHLTVYGYDEAGNLTGQNQVEVAAGVKRVAFVGDFIGNNPTPAYVVMQSDQPVIGFELFGGQSAPIMAGINADSVTSKTLYFNHVQLNEGEWTGITMINPGDANAAVSVYGYNDAGQVVATATALLAPHQKWVRFAQDLFGGSVPSTLSHLKVESDQPLTGFELVGDDALTRLDGLPAMASAYAAAEANVTAAGATLSVGETVVTIPAGALPPGTPVGLSERPLDSHSDGEVELLGSATFSLEPAGLVSITPLTITLPVTDSVRQKLAGSKHQSAALVIYQWNSLLQIWEALPTTVNGDTLSAFITTFTTYAIGQTARELDLSITLNFEVQPDFSPHKGWLIIKKAPKFGLIQILGPNNFIYNELYLPYMQHAARGQADLLTLDSAYIDLAQTYTLNNMGILRAAKDESLWCFFIPTSDSSAPSACAASSQITFWTVSISAGEYSAGQDKQYRIIILNQTNQDTYDLNYFPANSGRKTHYNAIAIDEPPTMQSSPGRDPVLLIHGINGTAEYWRGNVQHLRDQGFNAYAVFYTGWESIPHSADMVKAALDYVRNRQGGGEVDVITHSYGGVITRYYCLETEPGQCGSKIDDLVMIAPPHHGSLAAAKCVLGDPVVIFQRLHLGWTKDPNLPIYAELTPGSEPLLAMGTSAFPAGLKPLILAGAEGIGGLSLFHTEGLFCEDGVVSVPSASLLDAAAPVKLGVIELNHNEQPANAGLFDMLSGYLTRTSSPGFPIGGNEVVRYLWSSWADVVEEAGDGMLFHPYQAALIVDARSLGAEVDSVLFDGNWPAARTDLEMKENPANPGVFFYWDTARGTIDLSGTLSQTCKLRFENSSGTNLLTLSDVGLRSACAMTVQTGGHGGDLWGTDSIVGDLMYVPAGTFVQGSPADEPCRWGAETQFTHTLTRDLAVMATEVTQGMWAALRAMQPSLPNNPSFDSGTERPVESVTWYEAVLFANLLSVQRGLTRCYYTDAGFTTPVTSSNYTTEPCYCNWNADGYRLPTEGEWEYFCRAGTTTPFWIAEPNYNEGNCGYCSSGLLLNLESAAVFCVLDQGSAPVATKVPNPWGLYDTHGNVWEWCWDLYSEYYPAGSATDYLGAAVGSLRVFRGGGWDYGARDCRSADRDFDGPDVRSYVLGFRLVRGL